MLSEENIFQFARSDVTNEKKECFSTMKSTQTR